GAAASCATPQFIGAYCARSPRRPRPGTPRRRASRTRACRARKATGSSSSSCATERRQPCPTSSTTGSMAPSADGVRRVAVITHGRPGQIGDALERLHRVADQAGVQLVDVGDRPDLAVVLGGDGTMLRGLKRFLGTGTPVVGVNFGSVGFLTSVPPDELEAGLERAFAGYYVVVERRTL